VPKRIGQNLSWPILPIEPRFERGEETPEPA
jgi:hypothetical protein